MKNLVVFVDFTDGCITAMRQAVIISKRSGAHIHALHIIHNPEDKSAAMAKLSDFLQKLGVAATGHVETGDLLHDSGNALNSIAPDLVVLCTHGVRGLAQRLFGAQILKLVQALPYPCLVVQEKSEIREEGIRTILVPASPFSDFERKIQICARLASVFGSEAVLYEIEKYLGNAPDDVEANMKKAEEYFKAQGIRYRRVTEDNKVMSLGYARQTMNYAHDNAIDVVSMMSGSQSQDIAILKADKEAMLTNPHSVPVLCCP
jgi:nucleotide-binding universal stress UspA family protein